MDWFLTPSKRRRYIRSLVQQTREHQCMVWLLIIINLKRNWPISRLSKIFRFPDSCSSNNLKTMATKLRSLCCNQLLWRRVMPCMTRRIQASSSWREEQKTFFDKNDKLKRPMSPHLTIYSFPLPPLLSGSHRATGLAMFTGVAAFGIGVNLLPGDYTQFVEVIKALPYASALLFLTKLFITWPLCYHGMNGMRHLVWDTARGLDMKTMYTTGYAVVGLSILTAVGISLL